MRDEVFASTGIQECYRGTFENYRKRKEMELYDREQWSSCPYLSNEEKVEAIIYWKVQERRIKFVETVKLSWKTS